jgi:hypothetical protein
MEQTIATIISQFGPQIWLAFVTFVVTGFVMIMLKNFVQDLVNYFKVRMSDLGYGAMVIWQGKLKRVAEIKFKKIKLIDDEEIVFVPIVSWLNSAQVYPQPRHDQFDEKRWETKPWDGKIERRKPDVKNGIGSNA